MDAGVRAIFVFSSSNVDSDIHMKATNISSPPSLRLSYPVSLTLSTLGARLDFEERRTVVAALSVGWLARLVMRTSSASLET